MNKNKEIMDAIKETIDQIEESTEFKSRIVKLIDQIIEKPIDQAYLDDDIREVIELVDLSKEGFAK